MRAPAMAHYLEMKGWRAIQVGFESQSFFLAVPATHQPLDRERPGASMRMILGGAFGNSFGESFGGTGHKIKAAVMIFRNMLGYLPAVY